jgi:hypothetical protein
VPSQATTPAQPTATAAVGCELEEKTVRNAVAEAAWTLQKYDVEKVWEFLQVLEVCDSNSTTPIEDFITVLPMWWIWRRQRGKGLTPDDLVSMINGESDGVRVRFDDAVKIARDFRRFYGDILDENTDPEKQKEA